MNGQLDFISPVKRETLKHNSGRAFEKGKAGRRLQCRLSVMRVRKQPRRAGTELAKIDVISEGSDRKNSGGQQKGKLYCRGLQGRKNPGRGG